jgi:hypothetical protein
MRRWQIWEGCIMPKLVREVPFYSKHLASGQAVVTLSGQDFYLGPHGTKAGHLECDRQIAEWLARGRRPLVNDDAGEELLRATIHHALMTLPGLQRGRCNARDNEPIGPVAQLPLHSELAMEHAYFPADPGFGP